MIFLVVWGRLSDNAQKRKPFLVLGFTGFALILLVFSYAQSVIHVAFLQVVSAVFAAATVPVSSVYILRSARKEFWDQAIGEFNKISGYAWAFGMFLGTVLLTFLRIHDVFILLGIIGFVSPVLFQKMVREKPIYINRDGIISFANVMTEKLRLMPSYIIHFPEIISFETNRLKNFYLASFVLFVSSGLIFTPFVYFLTGKGASASFVFFISFLNAVISAFSYSRVAKKVALFGGFTVLRTGLVVRALFFAVLILASLTTGGFAVGLACVCYCVFGYTWAQITISSNSLMSRLAIEGKEGKIMGMYNFMASLGLITGNAISGVVVDGIGFTIEFLLGVFVIGLSLFWINKIKEREDEEMKLEVKKAFEKSLAERKKWWNVITYEKIDSYLEMAGIKKGLKALDVAAGDGIVASRLAKKGYSVTAVDISPALLVKTPDDVEYIVEDVEKMEFKREFDLVTCRNAFHYFPNPGVVLRRIRESLKGGGILLLMEPVATKESYSFLRRVFEQKAPVRTFFTEQEIMDMLGKEEFVILEKVREDYINWVKTDEDVMVPGVKTSYKNGILYFDIKDGYLIVVAEKRLRIIL
jgi:2-polyprenyl-3-methyl-5-hydroxy-6-metoxy-1,4-benzoquinol methylase/predicted MFS family arabinose efflux permease